MYFETDTRAKHKGLEGQIWLQAAIWEPLGYICGGLNEYLQKSFDLMHLTLSMTKGVYLSTTWPGI